MSDQPPDRMCADPRSRFHNAEALERGIGVRFKGVERTDVEEYCVSEGWVRLIMGKQVGRNGLPLTMKMQGEVIPYFRDRPHPKG